MKIIMYYVVRDIKGTDNVEYQAGPFSYDMALSYINDNDSELKVMCRVVDNLNGV